MTAIDDIAAERRRQIEVEGWSAEHDDHHTDGSLASAAAAYALCAAVTDRADRAVLNEFKSRGLTYEIRMSWPKSWALSWFKPSTPRRELVKAGALIIAEIERLDRAAVAAVEDDR